MVEAARLVVRVVTDTLGFERGIAGVRSQMDGLQEQFRRGAGFALGFDVITEAVHLLTAGIGDLEQSAVGLNAKMQQTQLIFEAFGQSAGQAASTVAAFRDIALSTPFAFEDMAKGAQRMEAMGIAAENLVPLMQDVAISASAIGGGTQSVQRITYALSQMASTGTVNAREMRELAMDGVPAWRVLSEAIGKTEEETRKMVRANQITAGTFIEAYDAYVQHDLGKLMEAQAHTFTGAMGIIANNVKFAIADAFKPLFDQLSALVVGFAQFVQSADFAFWAGAAQAAVGDLVGSIKELLSFFEPLAYGFERALAILRNGGGADDAFTAIRVGFQQVLSDIGKQINDFTGGMFAAGHNVVSTFAQGMWEGATTILDGVVTGIAQFIADFFIGHSPPPTGPLSHIQEGGRMLFSTYAQGMVEGGGAAVSAAQSVGANVGATFANGFGKGLTSVADVGKEAMDVINQVNQSMTLEQGRAAVLAAAGNMDALKAAALAAKTEIAQIGQAINDVNVVIAGLQLGIEKIKDSFNKQLDPIKEQITNIKDTAPNWDRKKRELELAQQENNFKLEQLKDPDYDKVNFDDKLSNLNEQARKLSAFHNYNLDDEIAKTKNQIVQITDGINSVAALNDKIQSLQSAVSGTSKSDVQESQMGDLLKERANAGPAERALIDQRLAGIRSTYIDQKKADDDKKFASQNELVRLTQIRDAQKIIDDEKVRGLRLYANGLEEQKRVETQTNQIASAQIREKIADLQDEKKRHDDIIKSQLDKITNEQTRLGLLDKQDDLQKQMLLLPLEKQQHDIEAAEKLALKPLEDQLKYWQQIGKELGLIRAQWGSLTADINVDKTGLGSNKPTGEDNKGPFDLHKVVDDKVAKALKDAARKAGADFAHNFEQGIEDWFQEHTKEIIAGGLGAVIGGALFGPLGAIAGGIFGVKLIDKITEIIKGGKIDYSLFQEGGANQPLPETGFQKVIDGIVLVFKTWGDWIESHPGVVKLFLEGLAAAATGVVLALSGPLGLAALLAITAGYLTFEYQTHGALYNTLHAIGEAAEWSQTKIEHLLEWLRIITPIQDNRPKEEWDQFTGPRPPGWTANPDDNKPKHPDPSIPIGPVLLPASAYADVWHGFTGTIDAIKNMFGGGDQGVLGETKVGADALDGLITKVDEFVQHITDVLGPGNTATDAVNSFKQTIIDDMGQGMPAQQALDDAKRKFEETFGSGASSAQAPITAFGTFLGGFFGKGGTLDQRLANGQSGDVPQVLANLRTAFDNMFNNPSGAQGPVSAFATFISNIFGASKGELFNTLVTNFPTVLSAFSGLLDNHFGENKPARTPLQAFSDYVTKMFGANTGLGSVLTAFGTVVSNAMPGEVAPIQTFLNDVGTAIHTIGGLFKIKDMIDFPIPTIGHADGLGGGMDGHWAMVGERGPEAMFVPKDSTIIPNHMLPGHADGYNVSALTLPGPFQGLADLLTNDANTGLNALNRQYSGGAAGARGSIAGAGDLIAAIIAATSNGREQMAMLLGAFIETGGQNIAQHGGGPGRGYWQIEAGPGGSHYGQLTESQAFDPFFAAKYMEGEYSRAMGYFNASDLENSLANVVYHAEKPANFYGPDQIDNAWNAIQQYLSGDGIAAAVGGGLAGAGGGDEGIFAVASQYLGSKQRGSRPGWDGWCQQFVDDVAEAAGITRMFDRSQSGSALEHFYHVLDQGQIQPGWGPSGTVEYWDESIGIYGHTDINGPTPGQGISTGSWGIGKVNQSMFGTPAGWAPLIYDNGGWINEPVVGRGVDSGMGYMFAKNGQPEKVMTQDQLNNAGGVHINLEVHIHADKHTDVNAIRAMAEHDFPTILEDALTAAGRR